MTHSDMAKSIHALLTKSNLQIPIAKAKDMVEVLEWLSAISDGSLVVSENKH